MRRTLPLIIAMLAAVLLMATNMENAAAVGSTPVILDNSTTGRVSVDTDTVKAVWHYKTLASENYHASGGNIYELYNKTTDLGMAKNLVSVVTNDWGNGQATPDWFGVGGVGATEIYASDTSPASSSNNNYHDFISDNNLSGYLESHSSAIDSQGNAILTFSYRVHNQSTGADWYRVVKTWTIEPNGAIHFKVDWTILRSGWFSEPAMRAKWLWDAEWDSWSKFGRDWGTQNLSSNKYISEHSGVVEELRGKSDLGKVVYKSWDSLNMFYADWVAVKDSLTDVQNVMMLADNGGQGWAGSGSYQMGLQVASGSSAMEQSAGELTNTSGGQLRRIGEYDFCWMAWWGGAPPFGNRYRALPAGTNWSDSYIITLFQGSPDGGPDISSISANSVGGGSEVIKWTTNVDSDSTVEVKTSTSNVWTINKQDNVPTKNHSLVIQGLDPQVTYNFRVKSRDSSGILSMSSGYSFIPVNSSNINLSLRLQDVYWKDYFEYLDRNLSVEYSISNQGSTEAKSVNITGVHTNQSVLPEGTFPVVLGDIPPNASSQVKLTYLIPSGVSRFDTLLYGSMIDSNGVQINFP